MVLALSLGTNIDAIVVDINTTPDGTIASYNIIGNYTEEINTNEFYETYYSIMQVSTNINL